MGTRAVDKGPTAERVAANIKRLRNARGITLDELARRLGELGRPILKSGLSKIETGERRVDVDDLVALAIALQTNTNALLLDPEADDELMQVTEDFAARRDAVWFWACGIASSGLGPWPWARFIGPVPEGKTPNSYPFEAEARPHDPPRRMSVEEWEQLRPWTVERDRLFFAMMDAGLPRWMFHQLIKGAKTYIDGDITAKGNDRGQHQ